MTFEEELNEFLRRTGATIIMKAETGKGVSVSITTRAEQAVRRIPIHTLSPIFGSVRDAFDVALMRHKVQCASSNCVYRETHGRHG